MKRLIHLVGALALAGCGGGGGPSVEIVGATPEALELPRAADLTLHARYEDHDGDLGGGRAEIFDCRADGLVTTLAIPPIASQAALDARASIAGTLDLLVARVGLVESTSVAARCKDFGVQGSATGALPFCVVLTDASGRASEGACSTPIAVHASP